MKFNKTQQYRLDHHLCVDCATPLYAHEYNRGIARCERCRARFLGQPDPGPTKKVSATENAARMNRIARFNAQASRCLHCQWATYPGNSTLFCLSPVCMRDHK